MGMNVPSMAGLPDYHNADGTIHPEAYRERLAVVERLINSTNGWEQEKHKAEQRNLAKGYQNAIALQRMRDRSAKYGVDAQTQTAMAQLQQRQREYDSTHELELSKFGLDEKRFGLDVTKTAVDFLASPDRYAQAGNFLGMSGRVLAGQAGAGTYGSTVAPQGNTMQDFAVLQAGGNPYSARGTVEQAAAQPASGGADPRAKIIADLYKANPPSQGVGLDANDFAVLNATKAVASLNLTPQQQASIGSSKEYQSILGSNMKNLGMNPNEWWAQQQRTRPGQGSARRA